MNPAEALFEKYGLQWFWNDRNSEYPDMRITDYLRSKIAKGISVQNTLLFLKPKSAFRVVDIEKFIQQVNLNQRAISLKEEFSQGLIVIEYFNTNTFRLSHSLNIFSIFHMNEDKLEGFIVGYKLKKLFDPDLRNKTETTDLFYEEIRKLVKSAEKGLNDFSLEFEQAILETYVLLK